MYVIIGGTACDILMNDAGLDFRATKDIDLVLIVEAIDASFGERFWKYVKEAGYQHINKSSNSPEFYRFSHPISNEYPAMIELFARKINGLSISPEANVTPLPIDDEMSSLSAILLNDDYYDFLRTGIIEIDGINILDVYHLIPFKMKAWLDLSKRKSLGEKIDEKSIKKHKNDVFRLSELMNAKMKIRVSETIYEDINNFITYMKFEEIQLDQIGLKGKKKEEI